MTLFEPQPARRFDKMMYFVCMVRQKQHLKPEFSKAELRVTRLVCEGYTIREMGLLLKLNKRAVETLRFRVFQKLGVNTIAKFAVEAIKQGFYSEKENAKQTIIKKQTSIFSPEEWVVLKLLNSRYRYSTIEKKLRLTPFAFDQLIEAIQEKIENRSEKEGRVKLSKEEINIIRLTCDGYSLGEIARKSGANAKLINDQRQRLYKKINVSNTASLAVYAITKGIYRS